MQTFGDQTEAFNSNSQLITNQTQQLLTEDLLGTQLKETTK